MNWKAFGFLLLVYVGTAPGASVYKWVDKEGNVHFSEEPPPTENVTAQQVDVTTKSGIEPELRRGRLRCGELELPRLEQEPAENIYKLEGKIEEWQHSLDNELQSRRDSAKRAIEYRGSGGFSHSDNRMGEFNCAIGWAKAELKNLAPAREKIAGRVDEIEKAISEVEQQKIARCGIDQRTGMVVVNDQYRAYKRCIEPFDRELSKLDGALKRAKTDRDRVAPY